MGKNGKFLFTKNSKKIFKKHLTRRENGAGAAIIAPLKSSIFSK